MDSRRSKFRGRRHSGGYNSCVRFEVPVVTEDAGAGRRRKFEPAVGYEAVWCRIVEAIENESFTSQQLKGQVGLTVQCHYFPALLESWRMVNIATDEVYAILGTVNHDDREWEISAIRSPGRS